MAACYADVAEDGRASNKRFAAFHTCFDREEPDSQREHAYSMHMAQVFTQIRSLIH